MGCLLSIAVAAVTVIGADGPAQKKAEPMIGGILLSEWIVSLTASNQSHRLEAVQALAKSGKEAAPAVPALIRLLKDSSPAVRCRTAEALEKIGVTSRDVVAALTDAVADPDNFVRQAAGSAIAKLEKGAQVRAYTVALGSPRDVVRRDAAFVLGELGAVAKEAWPALEHVAARDDDAFVRGDALRALGRIGAPAEVVEKAVLLGLKDGDWNVRQSAVGAVRAIANRGAVVERVLHAGLDDAETDVRIEALRAAEELKRSDAAIIKKVRALLGAPTAGVKLAAGEALLVLDPGARASCVDAFVEIVETAEGPEVGWALRVLEKLGPAPVKVVRAAAKVLDGDDRFARKDAAQTLRTVGVGSPLAAECFVKWAADKDDETVRLTCIMGLGAIKVDTPEVRAALVRGLSDRSKDVRLAAIEALLTFPSWDAAIEALTKSAKGDPDKDVQKAAAEALVKLKMKDAPKKP